jgi:hypothetical protein
MRRYARGILIGRLPTATKIQCAKPAKGDGSPAVYTPARLYALLTNMARSIMRWFMD